MGKFIHQLLLAIDQLLNTVIWISTDGFGMADETISARAWRLRECSRMYLWIDRLFFWDKDHSRKSYESEFQRNHLPNAYRRRSLEDLV